MIPNRDIKLKIICCVVMLAAIALVPSVGISDLQAREHDHSHAGPLHSDFVESRQEPAEPCYGYIPPPMDLSQLDAAPVERLLNAGALPGSFNWSGQGKVTAVKNQLPCGTCWIFGPTSVLESAVLIAENTTYDFSEQSVALCVDRSWVYLYDDFDEPCGLLHGGGWSALAAEVFIKKGAVLESCDLYDPSGLQCDGACLCDSCTPVKIVDGYRLVTNNQSQTDLIKEVVYNQGPVTVAYRSDGAHLHTDATYGAVYDCATCGDPNHMVSIIGWDDSVPHFETPGTGAWLAKNSWGTGFGNNGHFWLAYNSSCMQEIAYLEYKDYDPNEKLCYWDEAGWVDDHGYQNPSAWMANIFTSTQDSSLTHVDFWTTSSDAQYEIYVYLDGDVLDGLDNLATSQSGTCQELGYYSIPLNTPISLTSGQPFTIAVKMTTPGHNDPIPVEEIRGEFVEPPIQGTVSYARSGDTEMWEDLASAGFNACLRARVRSEAATAVAVDPASSNVGMGDTFTVDIYVNPDTAIAGAQFNLSFDASVMVANGVTEGDLLSQGGAATVFTPGTIDDGAGTITGVAGAIVTPGESVSQSGTFATVSFTAGRTGGTSTLDLSNVILADNNGQSVPITVSHGSATVCPDWDVNLDLSVNVLDMTLVGQHWGESGAVHWIREDVMRDGEIDVLDMILIGQHWTG